MKAIMTKYLGPTVFHGSSIKAFDKDGNTTTIPYPYELSGEEAYRKAAIALCAKMGWPTNLVGGETGDGYVFCFGLM